MQPYFDSTKGNMKGTMENFCWQTKFDRFSDQSSRHFRLKPPAKFHNHRTTPSGRKVTQAERDGEHYGT